MARSAAILSTVAALIVVAASFLQWWSVTYNGRLLLRTWAKVMLGIVFVLLIAALILLLA